MLVQGRRARADRGESAAPSTAANIPDSLAIWAVSGGSRNLGSSGRCGWRRSVLVLAVRTNLPVAGHTSRSQNPTIYNASYPVCRLPGGCAWGNVLTGPRLVVRAPTPRSWAAAFRGRPGPVSGRLIRRPKSLWFPAVVVSTRTRSGPESPEAPHKHGHRDQGVAGHVG